MRIKFLSAIASLFIMSFAITACLDSDDNIEYSVDATIHAFSLDSVFGKDYKFTIDQVRGEIYNLDSMPMNADTVINKILIDTLTVTGFVTSKADTPNAQDTLINLQDSINFLGTMEKPLIFKVWTPDLAYTKEYKISVRIHRQDPDSLNWGKITDNPIKGIQKAIMLGEYIFNFAEGDNKYVYTTPWSDGKSWKQTQLVGMPENFKLSSLINFNSHLYITTEDGNVYHSANGTTWDKHSGLSTGNVENLIASFYTPNPSQNLTKIVGISGIIKGADGKLKFNMTDITGNKWDDETTAKEVPDNFPLNSITSQVYSTKMNVLNAILVGNTKEGLSNDTLTAVWTSEDGKTWINITEGSTFTCPKLQDPYIMKYGEAFYIFGKGFEHFYTSPNLLVWTPIETKFLFPKELRGKESDYSMVVDEKHFMWLMCSSPSETWRGRLNRLGFKRQ